MKKEVVEAYSGEIIEKTMKAKGMTYEQLHRKTDIPTTELITIVNDRCHRVRLIDIIAIAKALDVTPEKLLGWETENKVDKYA